MSSAGTQSPNGRRSACPWSTTLACAPVTRSSPAVPRRARGAPVSRTEREVAVEITAATVKRGDVITIGGQSMKVQNLFDLPGGGKRIQFPGGAVLTLHSGTILTALRTAKGW